MSTSQKLPHFVVDKKGLAEMLARKGKSFIITELVSNSWDENSAHVDVALEWLGNGKVKVVVEDDNPEGFVNIAHAYTLYARSAKRVNAEQRGRFNLGEKLVVAVCDTASIQTTKGTIVFDATGRTMLKAKRKAGSVFTGMLSMTRAEYDEALNVVSTLLPPANITTTINLTELAPREPLTTFDATLRTEIADDEGRLKPSTRKCEVQVFDPREGEAAMLYEMGIPVVPTDDRYHVNVMQKVPLNTDRDNVTPAYLRDVRTMVLNHVHAILEPEAATEQWVTEAISDEKIEPEAVESVITKRYGDRRVIMDPTDPEANRIAASEGYTVIPGGALPKAAWSNVKGSGAALPAGKVTPSPGLNEGDDVLKMMDPEHYPDAVVRVIEFSKMLAKRLMGVELKVGIVNDPSASFNADYAIGIGRMRLNYGRLGHKWFNGDLTPILDLLFDEFAHQYESNHLSREYYMALRRLGAKTVALALEDPDLFDLSRYGEAVAA